MKAGGENRIPANTVMGNVRGVAEHRSAGARLHTAEMTGR